MFPSSSDVPNIFFFRFAALAESLGALCKIYLDTCRSVRDTLAGNKSRESEGIKNDRVTNRYCSQSQSIAVSIVSRDTFLNTPILRHKFQFTRVRSTVSLISSLRDLLPACLVGVSGPTVCADE